MQSSWKKKHGRPHTASTCDTFNGYYHPLTVEWSEQKSEKEEEGEEQQRCAAKETRCSTYQM